MVLNLAEIVRHWRKRRSKYGGEKKNYFLKTFFELVRVFFFELFLLVSSVNLFEVYCKKREKSKKISLHTVNGGVRGSGYTYRGGYTYRAGCMYCPNVHTYLPDKIKTHPLDWPNQERASGLLTYVGATGRIPEAVHLSPTRGGRNNRNISH